MVCVFCSQTIRQKSSKVAGSGPWVATYALRIRYPWKVEWLNSSSLENIHFMSYDITMISLIWLWCHCAMMSCGSMTSLILLWQHCSIITSCDIMTSLWHHCDIVMTSKCYWLDAIHCDSYMPLIIIIMPDVIMMSSWSLWQNTVYYGGMQVWPI